jgi:DNA-binding CsgD family transcriptional regulator
MGDAPEPIVIAVEIADTGLADRITALLADVPGLRLARTGEVADAALVAPPAIGGAYQQDVGLTPREIEVLNLMAEGASNKTIARRLEISVHTVKFHVGSLLDKLDAAGRTDAVAQAARLGVINL